MYLIFCAGDPEASGKLRYGKELAMCNYFKKTVMYNICSALIKESYMPKAVHCTYKFYRGSEWLKFCVDDDVYINFYHSGNVLSLDVERLEDDCSWKSLDRLTFGIKDEQIYLTYWRNGNNYLLSENVSRSQVPEVVIRKAAV